MLEVFKYLLHSNGQIQHFDRKIFFILWTSLIPAKVPVPTPAGPIQLNVGEGDLIFLREFLLIFFLKNIISLS